ncbi:UNVERIFIED_CONTAM: hypothetical protein Slati_1934100 [Sesamum latifolium]|uniref:RNase H type-1 domain-containing protein n=1 Tax=Sesamum latifolium TaxID=2727402 RepID=A0AAW2X1H2_9LAMI
MEYAITLDFPASNNEAEYEAVLLGSRLVSAVGAKKLRAFNDSQLVVNQVEGGYEAKQEKMMKYLEKLGKEMNKFEKFQLEQISREQNSMADQLVKFASSNQFMGRRRITLLTAARSAIEPEENEKMEEVFVGENMTLPWTAPIVQFLREGILLEG